MIRHELARRLGPEAVIIANGVAIREYTEIATGWMDDQSYGSDFYNETCGLYCGIDIFFSPFLSSSTSASTWGLTRFRIRPLASSKRRDRRVPRRALLDVSRSSAYLNTCLVLCFRRSCPNWGRKVGQAVRARVPHAVDRVEAVVRGRARRLPDRAAAVPILCDRGAMERRRQRIRRQQPLGPGARGGRLVRTSTGCHPKPRTSNTRADL